MVNYFAYGSNLYLKQMQDVFSKEKFETKAAVLLDYELIFADNGRAKYATIRKKKGAKVSGLLYNLTEKEILKLDALEKNGFGGYYRKKIKVRTANGEIEAEVYIMRSNGSNRKRMAFAYLSKILQGMLSNDFNYDYIQKVIKKAEGAVV